MKKALSVSKDGETNNATLITKDADFYVEIQSSYNYMLSIY